MIKETPHIEELRLELVHLKTGMNSAALQIFPFVYNVLYLHFSCSFLKWPTSL